MTEASTIINGRRITYIAEDDDRAPIDRADQIPDFATEGDEQTWWETHRLSETFWRSAEAVPEDRLPPVRDVPSRLMLRLPLSLHKELTQAAKADGVSLNTYIIAQLARGAGAREAAVGTQAALSASTTATDLHLARAATEQKLNELVEVFQWLAAHPIKE